MLGLGLFLIQYWIPYPVPEATTMAGSRYRIMIFLIRCALVGLPKRKLARAAGCGPIALGFRPAIDFAFSRSNTYLVFLAVSQAADCGGHGRSRGSPAKPFMIESVNRWRSIAYPIAWRYSLLSNGGALVFICR